MSFLLCVGRRRLILGDGDSMVASPPANAGTDLLTLIAQRMKGQPATKNIAVSGSSNGHSGYVTSPIASFGYLHTGHNSYLTGVAASVVHDAIAAVVTNWRNAGIAKIIVGTTFPGVDITGANETRRVAGNALVVADKCGADAVIEWDLIPYFTNTANFVDDGIHPPEAGRILMAQTIVSVANPMVQ